MVLVEIAIGIGSGMTLHAYHPVRDFNVKAIPCLYYRFAKRLSTELFSVCATVRYNVNNSLAFWSLHFLIEDNTLKSFQSRALTV